MNDLPPSMFTQITPETPAGARRLETIRELLRAGTVPEWWARLAAPHVDTVYPPRDVRERFAGAWARVWPRPRRADHPTVTDAAFEAIASSWDTERARADHFDRLRAEREAAAQAEAEAHKAADDAQRERDAENVKAQLRAQFLRLPGTNEQEFEERYPEILADHRRRLMAGQTTDATRAAVRHTLRGAYS